MEHFSSGPSAGRARGIPGSALVVLLVSAVPLGSDPISTTPPWAVESPAAAGARFGLGLDYLFEHQESLRIRSQRSVVSLPTEGGGTLDDIVDGDPDLLNRKFDLEWELKGPGVSVPLALSSFRLTDLVRVYPTLTLEAATVDVTLDSISKTEANPKTTLEGRGSLFGMKLGATASLCGDCPWFNGTTYHYRSLPAFEADRSPAFAEPGFEVLLDEVRLSQEVHEVSTKFGYIAPNKRVAYYTGVRTRWTDVEIEDELRLRSLGYGQQTRLASRTRLNSETIQAVAGVDAQLGGSFYARTETTFGDQDYGVLVKIGYVKQNMLEMPPKGSPVVAPTLKLFWDLASLQVLDSSVGPRLLSTDPWEPTSILEPLGVKFAGYRERLAKVAGVRPIILFLRHGTDPIEEARRRNIAITPWLPLAPPAFLSGPEVDTLILFQSLTSPNREPEMMGELVRAQIASTTGLAGFSLAESTPYDPLGRRFYEVIPREVPRDWERPVTFEHRRCRYAGAESQIGMVLMTTLTHQGGATYVKATPLSKESWKPCMRVHGVPEVTVKQPSSAKAGTTVIVAGSYFMDPHPSPLIADWIRVD